MVTIGGGGNKRFGFDETGERWADNFVTRLVERPVAATSARGRSHRRATTSSPVGRVVVGDLIDDAATFQRQATALHESGEKFPCLERPTSTPIPLNLELLGREPGMRTDEYLVKTAQVHARDMHLSVSDYAVPDARQFFRKAIRAFLGKRVTTARPSSGFRRLLDGLGGAVPASRHPGLPFEVHTTTPGLRTYYSPAYFFSPVVFGSSLSTPVTGEMDPGLYIFGAGPPSGEPTFEQHAEYEIPPTTAVHLGA